MPSRPRETLAGFFVVPLLDPSSSGSELLGDSGVLGQTGADGSALTWLALGGLVLFLLVVAGVRIAIGGRTDQIFESPSSLLGTETGRTDPSSERASQQGSILTDREQIHQLLETDGGKLRQSRIVDETDWSKAKVSRLLSQMESDAEIVKVRLGRENLICLRGEEPEIARPRESGHSIPVPDSEREHTEQ